MKLTRIPGAESTIKQSYSFRESTVTQLEKYKALYERTTRSKVALKDLVEQMLLDFMAGDKDFQKFVRDEDSSVAVAAPPPVRQEASPSSDAATS